MNNVQMKNRLTDNDRKFYKARVEFLKGEIEKLNVDLTASYSDRAKEIIADRIKSRKADYNQCENFLNNFA